MEAAIHKRQNLNQAIAELPDEALPELAEFIHYLQFKTAVPHAEKITQPPPGSAFLLAIAGIGETEETDLSERDGEIDFGKPVGKEEW